MAGEIVLRTTIFALVICWRRVDADGRAVGSIAVN
jgi:hypothetical protein